MRHAEQLALQRHGRLTIVLGMPRLPPSTGWAPVDREGLRRDLEAAAMRELRLAVEGLDPSVSVTTVAATDRLGCALARAWLTGCHDRVVLIESPYPWSAPARAARVLRRHDVPLDLVAAPLLVAEPAAPGLALS